MKIPVQKTDEWIKNVLSKDWEKLVEEGRDVRGELWAVTKWTPSKLRVETHRVDRIGDRILGHSCPPKMPVSASHPSPSPAVERPRITTDFTAPRSSSSPYKTSATTAQTQKTYNYSSPYQSNPLYSSPFKPPSRMSNFLSTYGSAASPEPGTGGYDRGSAYLTTSPASPIVPLNSSPALGEKPLVGVVTQHNLNRYFLESRENATIGSGFRNANQLTPGKKHLLMQSLNPTRNNNSSYDTFMQNLNRSSEVKARQASTIFSRCDSGAYKVRGVVEV